MESKKETINFPRIVFLGIMLLLGFIGIRLNIEFLQWIGFGFPAAYFFLGIVVMGNIRWIFMQPKKMKYNPEWFKTRRFVKFRNTFLYALLKESSVAIGIIVIALIALFIIGLITKGTDSLLK